MRIKLYKTILFLSILIIGLMLTAIAQDENLTDQIGPVGAYPGVPSSITPSGATTTSGLMMAYPSQPTTITPSLVTPATVQLSQVGQVSTLPAPAMSPAGTITAIYSTQAPPAAQQNVVLSYNVETAPPTAVYYSGGFMPWDTFYQMFPANSPMLWVSTPIGWSWYAMCPIGGWIQDLMYVPYTGTMKLYEFYPDGNVRLYNYGFATPGYKYIWFYADTPGRHISLFTIFDKPSNYITIDVM